ncbi:ATPase family AAA domain-containing protein 2-like [Schistocerca nitens]|uniref:ATPase family AAA domain-containing protein 2-like n=1 Tax=Schistocerca nitens TaxID=7011 RepID=UPI00211733FE|nr:ATPase family AAA domain-containing protein 2-like [Schistocerca nitens]
MGCGLAGGFSIGTVISGATAVVGFAVVCPTVAVSPVHIVGDGGEGSADAYLNRPAIIFFDELDAVAPIRSKRQDHVHASVVSTLLTLMDGLKSPQDVVVIGATNRLDEIDPALRRPGRFDKELFFPPPDLEARRTILNIHTRHWHTDTSSEFMDRLAENTAGYCGADLEALCTEALMCAMKRSISSEQSTAKSLMVHEDDFIAAKSKFVPAYLRSSISPACSLSEVICPLLQKRVESLMQQLEKNYSFKFVFPKQRFEIKNKMLFCPRILLTGSADQGLTSHLAPAILHRLEHLPVHLFDVTTLCKYNNLTDCGCIEVCMLVLGKGAATVDLWLHRATPRIPCPKGALGPAKDRNGATAQPCSVHRPHKAAPEV